MLRNILRIIGYAAAIAALLGAVVFVGCQLIAGQMTVATVVLYVIEVVGAVRGTSP